MSVARIAALVRVDLTGRIRSKSWYILLSIYAAVLLLVTWATWFAAGRGGEGGTGGLLYSVLISVALLMVLLVTPALSANAINGDRDNAILAPVQITRATTIEIVFAKWLAAVGIGIVFVLVAVPFLLFAMFNGQVRAATVIVSLLVFLAEVAVFAAIGTGFSGTMAKPLFSVAATYLVVAAFAVGTLIAFGFGMMSVGEEVEVSQGWYDENGVCQTDTYTQTFQHHERVWPLLAANPWVILSDATPAAPFNQYGYPSDLFSIIKQGVRSLQVPAEPPASYSCDQPWQPNTGPITPAQGTIPVWPIGLGIQAVVAALALWGAIRRTHAPAKRLPPGTRIA